jgi:heterotetrameric sarcosine oxidase delta subunit
MLRFRCPVCGLRDETEFVFGGDATVRRPAHAETDIEAWYDFVFLRDNPRGAHREYWHHAQGCRQWLVVERDTLMHAIGHAVLARDVAEGGAS